jgi:peptide-methionine (S)-S-oxide reductase
MNENNIKIGVGLAQLGFGGGCHWCTEAVFNQLKGVIKVRQGWIKSSPPFDSFSEAVIVDYDREVISEEVLIEIHLLTHAATSMHAMRAKYRSAIYFFDDGDEERLREILQVLQEENAEQYITKVLPLEDFKLNDAEFLDYYKTRPEAPFCQRHIEPKLRMLMARFGGSLKREVRNV